MAKRGRPRKIIANPTSDVDVLPFMAILDMAGKKYESTGDSAFAALSNFPELNYTHIKTKGVITLFHGDNKSEKLFYMRPLRMLFTSPLRRKGFARQMEDLLKPKSKLSASE